MKSWVKKMGLVVTVLKVFPEEGKDLNELLQAVKSVKGCVKAEIADYVFGAKIIQASFNSEDSEGRDFEEEASAIDGVSSCQVDEIGLA